MKPCLAPRRKRVRGRLDSPRLDRRGESVFHGLLRGPANLVGRKAQIAAGDELDRFLLSLGNVDLAEGFILVRWLMAFDCRERGAKVTAAVLGVKSPNALVKRITAESQLKVLTVVGRSVHFGHAPHPDQYPDNKGRRWTEGRMKLRRFLGDKRQP